MDTRQLVRVALATLICSACGPSPSESPDDGGLPDEDGGVLDASAYMKPSPVEAGADAWQIDMGAPLCGNARRDTFDEGCDDGNTTAGDGCSDTCTIEPGYECTVVGQRCALNVICGDGQMGVREQCDDGNAVGGDGCSADCRSIETYFSCATPGMPCVSTVVCGDKHVVGTELCDDGNIVAGDGCGASCELELGYACPVAGASCRAASCGDGHRVGAEQCDDGNDESGDGCDARCRYEPGFVCTPDTNNQDICRATHCGDGTTEGSEQCDDGPSDKPYDGCYKCQREPSCDSDGCSSVCGDGIKFPSEDCDDGNTRDGDGCSSQCVIEAGFTCTLATSTDPSRLDIPIIYRDFRGKDLPALPAKNLLAGHEDFENRSNGRETGITKNTLDADKKPVLADTLRENTNVSTAANFRTWYRDDVRINRTIVDKLTFNKVNESYVFDDGTFYPLDGRGFVAEGVEPLRTGGKHNYSFTSELRYWFEYKGGERLDFRGDDDVWVFINGRLAVDIGGVHGAEDGSVTLRENGDMRFGLQKGKIYEVVVFQAERHTTESSYKLTLKGFSKGRSSCESHCGDGVVTSDEVCDDQQNDGGYGGCMPGCQDFGPRCGDAQLQAEMGEQCDLGLNLGGHNGCAADCKLGPRCGDGNVDGMYGEQCDDGVNDGGYGECAAGCILGERCGDGVRQDSEQCDDGNDTASDGCDNACYSSIFI